MKPQQDQHVWAFKRHRWYVRRARLAGGQITVGRVTYAVFAWRGSHA